MCVVNVPSAYVQCMCRLKTTFITASVEINKDVCLNKADVHEMKLILAIVLTEVNVTSGRPQMPLSAYGERPAA